MSRTASGATTATQYAGGAPVTEMQGSTFTAAYTLGHDLLRRNGEYPAFDGPGSARAETNSSGSATAAQDFGAFGNTIASSGSTSSPYNFAADWAFANLACPERSRGGDAGLQHVGARYYDPQVGRFASRDSMLDQIPYAYCGGEPNDWLDPSGDNAVAHARPIPCPFMPSNPSGNAGDANPNWGDFPQAWWGHGGSDLVGDLGPEFGPVVGAIEGPLAVVEIIQEGNKLHRTFDPIVAKQSGAVANLGTFSGFGKAESGNDLNAEEDKLTGLNQYTP